jgi:hypothetical protein
MRAVAVVVLTILAACGQTAVQGSQNAASQSDSAQVISRLPLIDACLALSPVTPTVTINPSLTSSVRLSGETGSFDCVVPDDAADPANASILPALDTAPTDAILFVRAPGANPGGECYEAPEVRDNNGELLGWLLDPEGC